MPFVCAIAVAAGPVTPVSSLAGRYAYRDTDVFSRTPLDNVLEIVPVDATHAYFRMALEQQGGFSCDVSGIARATRNGLYYRAPPPASASDDRCELTITRTANEMIVDDTDSHHCRAFCGMNAELSDAFKRSSRRPIAYLARLRQSREYRHAIAEWRNGRTD